METALSPYYIYIVGLKLMLLIVLTSISVVVAAKWQREFEIYTRFTNKALKRKGCELRFKSLEKEKPDFKNQTTESFGWKSKTD